MTEKIKRVVENDEFIAMMQRQVRALERRATDDPAILAQVIMLAQRLDEITNIVISRSAARYKIDPYAAPSAGEIARMLKMTKQSASERRKTGDRIDAERAMDIEPISKRERAARTRAARYAEETMASWLQRRDHTV